MSPNESVEVNFEVFMKRLLCVFVLLFSIYGSSFTQDKRPVYVLELNGVINPVSAKFIHEALDQAQEDGAECFIIQMDTPGGLMESMRTIIKDILASRIPVIVYVNPSGSRAASAGVFICYSAHIVAMTPGTNIGAAHPVTIGQTDSTSAIMEKVTNDAAAYIRSLAEKRNRNVEWGEKAVRESVSITEKEALELNVIDYIVPTLDSLLSVIDGKEVDMDDQKYILHTENAEIITIRMNWRFRILDKISDPNIAYILMLLGMYGIIFELSNPGSVLPGIVGVIFLILAFFAMQTLPLNYAGLMLIIFAIILFLLEIKVVSYGLLSIGGVISMLLGSLMLFDSPEPFFKVSLSVILPAVILTAAFFLFAIGFGLKAQKQKPVSGAEGIIGEVGVAIEKINPEGRIKVHGEFWNAVAESPIKPKEKVKVCAVLDGLMLKVEPLKKSD